MQENIVKKACKELGITQKELAETQGFDKWNDVKKQIQNRQTPIHFKEREVYWASIGKNIGHEQDGKGEDFSRPVVVVKKLNDRLFFGVPLSTKLKNGSFFHTFSLNNSPSTALLVQSKVMDIKRADRKLGMITKEDFSVLKIKIAGLLTLCSPAQRAGSPEGN